MDNTNLIIINTHSILLGLVFGIILGKLILQPIIYKGPVAKEVQEITFMDHTTKKCYQYNPQLFICPIKISMNRNKVLT